MSSGPTPESFPPQEPPFRVTPTTTSSGIVVLSGPPGFLQWLMAEEAPARKMVAGDLQRQRKR